MSTMTGFSIVAVQPFKQLWRTIVSPVAARLQALMSSGLTPQKLALTLCLGSAIGVMPLVWGTSLICILLAHCFKLNHVALQSVNYLLYPVQLALLVPFFKLGERVLPWGPPVPPQLLSSLFQNLSSSLTILGWITIKSLVAWSLTALPAALLAYILQKMAQSRKTSRRSGQ
jgi:uncharacterized protein (DUF2062 family)